MLAVDCIDLIVLANDCFDLTKTHKRFKRTLYVHVVYCHIKHMTIHDMHIFKVSPFFQVTGQNVNKFKVEILNTGC